MSNVVKFSAPFEKIKYFNDKTPEIGLRKAIILQAIIDASNKSLSSEAVRLEKEAKEWLFGGSQGFKMTCYEAYLEPDYVIKTAKEIIDLHDQQIEKSKREKEIQEKFRLLI